MSTKKNTVKQGNAFEKKVFFKMKYLMESDMLGISGKNSKIFAKKSYIGKTGNKIIFDIAIETYHPDSNEYSILILIECKDHKHPIQSRDMRDFADRIEDVGGHKGYFIISGAFQEGALKVARSKSIGLAKFNIKSASIEDWYLRRIQKVDYKIKDELIKSLYSQEFNNDNQFISVCGNDYYTNLIEFMSEQFFDETLKTDVPYMTEDTINSYIIALLRKLNIPKNMPISTETLIRITKEIKVNLVLDEELTDESIGQCSLVNKTIYISPNLKYNCPKWRFTLAHEIGHYILHYSLYSENKIGTICDNEELNITFTSKSLKRLEIQANKFATNLLVPDKSLLYYYILKHQQLNLRNSPFIYLDKQPCNIYSCNAIFSYLGNKFNVSKEVIKYKLENLKLLIEN